MKTKAQRQAWWSHLSPEEKSAYIAKKEQERGENKSTFTTPPPLTETQMRHINATMRQLGLEKYIVLPDL